MVSPHVRPLLDVWFSFHIVGGHFLVPVLIVTFLFSKARRDATLINFGITLSLSSVFNCLLLYAHESLGPEPNKRLCIIQAATFGASAPMWSVAALTLTLQIRSRVQLKPVRWLPFMLVAPYIFFIIFLVAILVVGSRRPHTVTRARRTFYCSIESRAISLASICFTSGVALVAISLAMMMSYQLYNFLSMVRRARRPQIRIIPLATRLVIFMLYLFCAIVTSLWSIKDRHTFIRDIYTSTFSVAYFLVFGTQRDVFRAWCFWRKDHMDSNLGTIEKEAESAEFDIVTSPSGPSSSECALATLTELGGTHESLPTCSPMRTPYTGTHESLPTRSPMCAPYTDTHYSPSNISIDLQSTRSEADP